MMWRRSLSVCGCPRAATTIFCGQLRTFFLFAQNHGWLSKEVDLLARVEKRSEKRAPVEIFTPTELTALLKNASSRTRAVFRARCICGIARRGNLAPGLGGHRTAAGIRRSGSAQGKDGHAPNRADPGQSRAMAGYRATQCAERVWQHSKAWFFEAMRNAAADAKIKWKQNALRHSFITYRLAEIQDVNRVALEAGNSPQMIFRHYRELATPDQARTWFSIAPGPVSNIVPISRRKSSV